MSMIGKPSKPGWLNKTKLLAWDLDGTLYPPNPELSHFIHQEVIKAIAEATDSPPQKAQKLYKEKYNQLQSTTKTLDSYSVNGQEFFLKIWAQDLEPYIKPNPELVKLLLETKKKLPFQHAIMTNSNTTQTASNKLECVGIDPDFFTQIFTSVEIGHNKPDPQAFAPLYEELPFAPNEIVYIGDREKTDIIPAKKLGLKTVHITDSSSSADLTFPQPEDFLLWLLV